MLGTLYAFLTIFAWGSWLTPSQTVVFKNQQIKIFYVTAINLALVILVALTQNLAALTFAVFWPPFLGGLVWAVSGLCAFTAADKLGMTRAYGIWAPLNIVVSVSMGALLFQEFAALSPAKLALLFGYLLMILAGVLMIILPKDSRAQPRAKRDTLLGLAGAFGAGILWGVYFLPSKALQIPVALSNLPLSLGMFTGSAILTALARRPLNLPRSGDYLRVLATGVMWTIGNYAMLLMTIELGAGKGYTLAQLSVVVNALLGIFLLKDPAPRSKAAAWILAGCVLATAGGILLGNLQ